MAFEGIFVQPIRDEIKRIGFEELTTPEQVDETLGQNKGTLLVFVNSVCGCASGRARPALGMSLEHDVKPERTVTVFAGQDKAATAQVRSYFTDYMPSSPSIGLMRDDKLVFFLERHQIEGRNPEAIAADLVRAYDQFCTQPTAA